ncbi:hypothetical protein [Salinibaculum rarum]|uniref:hypothetical protein n=1 Tax=Salinibaculum rarum TaxID=3058903 RepID=UPI00265EDEE0|nr:hypothetical protein [Salinibaculum sp. KK48]
MLDFAVEGEDGCYTWEVEDVDHVENIEENRFIMYPEWEFFVCKIESASEEGNEGTVRC